MDLPVSLLRALLVDVEQLAEDVEQLNQSLIYTMSGDQEKLIFNVDPPNLKLDIEGFKLESVPIEVYCILS